MRVLGEEMGGEAHCHLDFHPAAAGPLGNVAADVRRLTLRAREPEEI
jgi:hypothetical protein